MADDRTQRGEQDRSRINHSQRHEVAYWARRFGVTEDQLKDAARQAGPEVARVAQCLGKPR